MAVRSKTKYLAAGVIMLAAQASWAEEGAWTVGTGYNFSSGKYGTSTTTDITSVPLTAAYEQGPWTMKLSVPYVSIDGSSDVVVGIGRPNRGQGVGSGGTTTTTRRTESGLGDVTAAATYNFFNDAAAQMGADVTAKVKFGTADEAKGLGTGENDYSLALDVYKRIDRWTVFGGVGYSVLGSSSDIKLDNVFNANAGAAYKVSDQGSAGMAYDYRQKTSSGGDEQSEMTAFYSHRFDKSWKGQAYVLSGFSDGSPDWGGGLSVGYAF